MKKNLLLLFALVLFSCDMVEPKTYPMNITAKYKLLTEPNKVFPDKGATIYIFNGINLTTSTYTFDGVNNLKQGSKTIPFDQSLTLDDNGQGKLILKRGHYAVVCVSGNVVKNGIKQALMTSNNVDGDFDDLNFEIKNY